MSFWRPDERRWVGKQGEDAAARFLRSGGAAIVERNVRSRLGEIDLVARERGTLVFVEVKCRRGPDGDPPRAAVTANKQRRLPRRLKHVEQISAYGESPSSAGPR